MKKIHISTVKSGDIILHNGKPKTVGSKDIKSGFMGTTVFGDSYRLGTVPVILMEPQEVNAIEGMLQALKYSLDSNSL